jgi:hypothetical protein
MKKLPQTQQDMIETLTRYSHLAIKDTCKTAGAARELVRKGIARVSTDSQYPAIAGHTRYVLIETPAAVPMPVFTHLGALADLEGAYVRVYLFDDPSLKYEMYEGTIEEVKSNWAGAYVRFKAERGPSHITGSKWISVRKVDRVSSQTANAIAV